ncbi:2514_t:CDS:2, partial [Dentiscutata erythropus]
MPPKSRKRELGTEQDEVTSVLDALKAGSSTSAMKKQQNTSGLTCQRSQKNKVSHHSFHSTSASYEITESPPRSPLNKILTNTSEKLSVDTYRDEESKTINALLEMTNKILMQNTSIMEKQEALESTVTYLVRDIKALQSSQENLKLKANDNDNWLYSNERIYEESIHKELEEFCPDKIERYKKISRWEGLYSKIENSIGAESCKYHGALFGSFRHAVFENVFKNKISPSVNSESSEAEITSWKSSKEVQWCFENLDTIIKEENKTYLQMVAKKVFGRQPTKNQCAVTRAILHNLFNPKIVKIKFDEKYLTRKLKSFLV